MKLEPATIEIIEPRKLPAELPRKFTVQFNPTEYTRTKAAQFAEIGIYGIDSPVLQFVRGQNEKITLELFFDTTDSGMGESAVSVTTFTRRFYLLAKLQRSSHAPPKIKFTWSSQLSFVAVVESVQQRFTLFNPQGVPLRATLSVTLREYRELKDMVKELESDDHSRVWPVKQGDSLNLIAGEIYGDPGLWREIANANPGLENPRRLPPGAVLLIPPLDEFRRSRA